VVNPVAADLWCENQSGMNGVAIDPDFTNNRFRLAHAAPLRPASA